ncbi:hypothetical protein D3C72_2234720 [compost metagenome]
MRLVRKLTRVPSAAVNTVWNKSPSEKLAQMEQRVLPREEMRKAEIRYRYTIFQCNTLDD